MCYRCNVCSEVVPHGVSQRRHVISRVLREMRVIAGSAQPVERTEIEQEVPVCFDCDIQLRRGTPLAEMYRRMRSIREANESMNGYIMPAAAVPVTQPAVIDDAVIEDSGDNEPMPLTLKPSPKKPPGLHFDDSRQYVESVLKKKRRAK